MTSFNDPFNTSSSSLNLINNNNGIVNDHQPQEQQNIENHLSSMASPSQQSTPMTNATNSATTIQPQQQNTSSSNTSSGGISILRTNNLENRNTENQNLPVLTKPRLQELVREVDPTEQLDEEVEEILLQIADDFVEDTVKSACAFAKHRKVPKIEVRDVQLHLERKYNMWIPGFGTDELRPYKRATVTEAHKQRLALIRKTIKKY